MFSGPLDLVPTPFLPVCYAVLLNITYKGADSSTAALFGGARWCVEKLVGDKHSVRHSAVSV